MQRCDRYQGAGRDFWKGIGQSQCMTEEIPGDLPSKERSFDSDKLDTGSRVIVMCGRGNLWQATISK